MFSNMPEEEKFRCPVCRASQSLQSQCRRCNADLRLTMRARQRLAYLLRQRAFAIRDGDLDRREKIQCELNLLAPRHSDMPGDA